MRSSLGKKFIEKGTSTDIKKIYQNFSQLYITEKFSFNGKDTVVTYVDCLDDIIDIIRNSRGLRRPWVMIGADLGQNELLIVLSVVDQDNSEDSEDKKAVGAARSLIIGAADCVTESTESIKFLLIEKLKLDKLKSEFVLCLDLKMVAIVTGLSDGLPKFGCPYCVSCRDRVSSARRKYKFWFREGVELRSHESNLVSFTMFQLEAGGNEKKLIKYNNVKNDPIAVLPPGDLAKPYLLYLPPEPLHLLLGVMNDVLGDLEKRFPAEMKSFCETFHILQGDMIGGAFNGPAVKAVLQEPALVALAQLLGVEGEDHVEYLHTVRELHILFASRSLSQNYPTIINNWKSSFRNMYENYDLSMTLKDHILYEHLEWYFTQTGLSLYFSSAEGTEATHSRFRKHKEKRQLQVRKRTGTDLHVRRHHSAVEGYNAGKFGF